MENNHNILIKMNNLEKGWKLALYHSKEDFINDPYRFIDYKQNKEKILQDIFDQIVTNQYQPKPLKNVEKSKSDYSIRPGAIISLEDKIVLFAILTIISQEIDKKLPENVRSYRIRRDNHNWKLFEETENLNDDDSFFEPWYDSWPGFYKDLQKYYNEGYQYLIETDIVAYFENIDLNILRNILLKNSTNQDLTNYLMNILGFWSSQKFNNYSFCGIPQGNAVSSFLGNVYLLSLDNFLKTYESDNDIRWLRFSDDLKILTKDRKTAKELLLRLHVEIRKLKLNIHYGKTIIIRPEDVEEHIMDYRLDEVNLIIDSIPENIEEITEKEKSNIAEQLSKHLRSVRHNELLVNKKDKRLFKRILTGFSKVSSKKPIDRCLKILPDSTDYKLIDKVAHFLSSHIVKSQKIADDVLRLLRNSDNLFDYQKFLFIQILRYQYSYPSDIWGYLGDLLITEKEWYLRREIILLLSMHPDISQDTKNYIDLYQKENHIEVKRAWLSVLSQIEENDFCKILNNEIFNYDSHLALIWQYCFILVNDENEGKKRISEIFQSANETTLLNHFFEINVLAKSKYPEVKQRLKEKIDKIVNSIIRKDLKAKYIGILKKLKQEKRILND